MIEFSSTNEKNVILEESYTLGKRIIPSILQIVVFLHMKTHICHLKWYDLGKVIKEIIRAELKDNRKRWIKYIVVKHDINLYQYAFEI